MVMLDKYPEEGKLGIRVDHFIYEGHEGSILIVGKDSKGEVYYPRNPDGTKNIQVPHSYETPSECCFSVPVGSDLEKNYPALQFPYRISKRTEEFNLRRWLESNTNENLLDNFMLQLFPAVNSHSIEIKDCKVNKFFKTLAVWPLVELASIDAPRNHFWGELYLPRIPELEVFLEDFRGK